MFLLWAWLSQGCTGTLGRGQEDGQNPSPIRAEPSDEWCDRVAPGPKGDTDPIFALSRIVAEVRFFGLEPGRIVEPEEGEEGGPGVASCSKVDLAFARAIEENGPDPSALNPFSDALSSVCSLPAADVAVPESSMVMVGSTALIEPGTGPVDIPTQADAVAVDLRQAWNWPGLKEQIERIVAMASLTEVDRCPFAVRVHHGLTDEVISRDNVYFNEVEIVETGPIPPQGKSDLPLAFIVGPEIPPPAARIAGCTRLGGRAWIFGHEIISTVAESRWLAAGGRGIAYRFMELQYPDGSGPWPDVIEPDAPGTDLDKALAGLPDSVRPGPYEPGHRERQVPLALDCFRNNDMEALDCGSLRAGLLSARGALGLFYPYQERLELELDPNLPQMLDLACPAADSGRQAAARLLKELSHLLADGHSVVMSYQGGQRIRGTLPIYVEHLEAGVHAVRRSLVEGVDPGDVIVAIQGEPASDWYAHTRRLVSASTPGYELVAADDYLHYTYGPVGLDVKKPDGSIERVFIEPRPFSDLEELVNAPSDRESGFLDDLGAGDIMYINLEGTVLNDQDRLHRLLDSAGKSASGLVLDLRGYPTIDHYDLARRILDRRFKTPKYVTLVLNGPSSSGKTSKQYELDPLEDPSYRRPVAVLLGPSSISAAENLALLLEQGENVTTVGRRTAGTNGNITGLQLASGFSLTFTGMDVVTLAGESFMGRGVVPDVVVEITPEQLARGLDPELEAALSVFGR